MKILSSFSHPIFVANLYDFLSSVKHKNIFFYPYDDNESEISFKIPAQLWKRLLSDQYVGVGMLR